MISTCDFCQNTHQTGEIYCSRANSSKEETANGAFLKRAKEADSDTHLSRLSIRTVHHGLQHYRIDGRNHVLSPGSYLILNNEQQYRTHWKSVQEQEMVGASFKPGFAEQVLHSLITPQDQLLDNPQEQSGQPLHFFNQVNEADPVISQMLDLLVQHMTGTSTALALDTLYVTLLERLLVIQRQVHQTMAKLGPVKVSTRIELYNRLTIARDFIDANLHQNITLDEVASEACLSKFHFMRLFKQAFGQTVHQYITSRRLSRTRLLLELEEKSFQDICRSMGYEDVAWFAKVYKRTFGISPTRSAKTSALILPSQAPALAVA